MLNPDEQKVFVVLHRRWVVERTFVWLNHRRRLGKDGEPKVALKRSCPSEWTLAMPHRTRGHLIEDESRDYLRTLFHQVGWVVEDLYHDYGEDLLVRVFDEGETTPLLFFVQVKATDRLSRYLREVDRLEVPLSRAHVLAWNRLLEPVLIVVWDSQTDIAYWQSIQAFLDTPLGLQRLSKAGGSIHVRIPTANILDRNALPSIRSLAENRLSRALRDRERADILCDLLEDAGYEIEDDGASGEVIVIRRPDGDYEFLPYGKLLAKLEAESERLGMSLQEYFVNRLVR